MAGRKNRFCLVKAIQIDDLFAPKRRLILMETTEWQNRKNRNKKKSVAKSLTTDFHNIAAEKLKNRKQPKNKPDK